ncbi:MAG: molybdopterin-containing oxidoreductase family protein [Acidimicrobiales bacterium]
MSRELEPKTPNGETTGWREVIGSCPLDCPDACSWVVTVDPEGRATKLRGNPDHPFTQGGLCKKVNPWLEFSADPSRLTEPMRRVGPKGSGRFEAISWDDALSEMAERFQSIIDSSGGAAIWPFVGTGNLGWLQGSNGPARVWSKMGASAHHLTTCSVAGRAGIEYSVGTGAWLDPEHFTAAGSVMIWASNTLVTNRHLWPFVEQAREAGAPLIVVDPVRSRTAEAADIHLAPRPGTDGALALGLCQAIVNRGGADHSFLDRRTLGWPQFAESLKAWSAARTETVTGVAGADIERVAQLLIDTGPLALRIGHGVQRQANGGQAMRVVSCLPAILGAYDQPGGGSLYSSTGVPKGFNVAKSKRPELGARPRTLAMTNLGRNLLELDDPPVEALIVYGANPLVSNPETQLVRRGLERQDLFTVVIDLYPTETAAYADLVLPSTMQHEQLEINDSYNHRYVHWNQPAVAPPGDCLPHTEIFRRLARAMGYEDTELFATDEQLAADVLDSDEFRASNIDVEQLKSRGYAPLPPQPGPAERAFPTPSGLFEFTSAEAAKDGHGELPNYRAGSEASDLRPDHLALIAAASDFHINSTFAGTVKTGSRTSTPELVVHPDDAATRGLATGDRAAVHNERGRFEVAVVVAETTRAGVASITKGWWQLPINNTVEERDADMASGATFHDNAVLVSRLD